MTTHFFNLYDKILVSSDVWAQLAFFQAAAGFGPYPAQFWVTSGSGSVGICVVRLMNVIITQESAQAMLQ